MQAIVNSKGKKRIRLGHPWVFRSDIKVEQGLPAGVVSVVDENKKPLGVAFYSPHSQIALRMISQKNEVIDESFWKNRLLQAARFRRTLQMDSNAYRMVFGESDGIPSLILDRYDQSYSFQSLSAGLEAIRPVVLDLIKAIFNPLLLVERNDVQVRNLEQLPLCSQVLWGEISPLVQIKEGKLIFEVDLLTGQKTGAFLDQRENRLKAGWLAQQKKRVLDSFSYQGWFACHMALQAESVVAVEQSEPACKNIAGNLALNHLSNVSVVTENVFDYLKEASLRKERFDLINLDPPAFVKARSQLGQALKGYKEINLRALKLLGPDGILITSSCSHLLSEDEFLHILRDAALDAKKRIQIIGTATQGPDHPVLLGFPESKYLKCFFLRVVE